jgi:polysaccharide pyruvyl transferase WcaK-like protein
MVKKAKKAGKKVFLVGQGVGPLNKFISKRAAASAFAMADGIVVRDPTSAQAIKNLGVSRPVRLGADPAFLMPPGVVEESQYGVGDRKTIGIAPRIFGKGVKEVTAIFGEFARSLFQSNYMPVMIAMDRNEDGPLIQAISDAQGGKIPDLRKLPTPGQVVAQMARMDAVVSVRLHGAVLATCAGTPAMMVSYDPKVAAFAKLLEIGAAIPAEGLTAARLFENFQTFMKARERNVQIIERKRTELQTLAEVNVELVLESLKSASAAR